MPQMAPLSWIILSPFSLVLFLSLLTILYFEPYMEYGLKTSINGNNETPKFKFLW